MFIYKCIDNYFSLYVSGRVQGICDGRWPCVDDDWSLCSFSKHSSTLEKCKEECNNFPCNYNTYRWCTNANSRLCYVYSCPSTIYVRYCPKGKYSHACIS